MMGDLPAESDHGRGDLAERINREHEQVEQACRAGLKHAIEAGRLLNEAKATVAFGQWGHWIAANCRFSDRTARAYVQVYGKADQILGADRQRVAEVPSFREALALIAEPKEVVEPEPAFDPEPEPTPGLTEIPITYTEVQEPPREFKTYQVTYETPDPRPTRIPVSTSPVVEERYEQAAMPIMPRVSLRFNHELLSWVDSFAKHLNITRDELISGCLTRGLKAYAKRTDFEAPPE